MRKSPLYTARYWSDAERDALESYALYWNQPKASHALGLILGGMAAAALGLAAGPWLAHGDWVLPALALGCAAFLFKESKNFSPLEFFSARAQARDFSGSETHGALLEIQKYLEKGL